MSSADVIDALSIRLFVRTVDMVQSLPKQGPIQTSYEEKLALYSLYKQATEGDVQSKRPGMLDMLGRAKWDAWAKMRGLPSRDAKQMYVESMLRILRRFSDRPQAAALIEELEAFSGQVAQRVMDGSLAQVDSDGSTVSSDESLPPQRVAPSDPVTASRLAQEHQQLSRPSLPQAGLNAQSLQRPMSTAGTSTVATRGGAQTSQSLTPLGSDSEETESDADDFDPRNRNAAAVGTSGDGLDRGYDQHGHQRPGNYSRGGPPRSHVSSPPPSALGLRPPRASSATGAPNRYHSTLQSPAPSSHVPPQHQQYQVRTALGPQSYQRSTYAASSIGGRSGRAGPSSQSMPRPPSVSGGNAAANRPEIDLALQSIQASLAALHERLNRVESSIPGRGSEDARNRRGTGSATATGRLFGALANIMHDLRQLVGLESSPQRSPRSEALAPSFLAHGGQGGVGGPGGRTHAARNLLTASWKVVVALINLVARLALDVISFALVSSIFLFAFKKLTGRGDPLLTIRMLGRVRRLVARKTGVADAIAIPEAPVVNHRAA